MSAATSIQWTDRTWSPVRGCSRVSPGCDNCYAMRQAHRFSGAGKPYEGLTTIRRGKVDWTGAARLVPSALDEPLRWRKPARVFVNSMSDLFHHSLTNEQIAAVFGAMAACPQHTFQVLTKRPERAREWFEWAKHSYDGLNTIASFFDPKALAELRSRWVILGLNAIWPLPNVWLGVSCEDQQRADERIPILLECPAAVRFVSAEPLLGPIDLRYAAFNGADSLQALTGLHWVIVGGESGHGARPGDVEWIESIVKQCREADVACFVKQLGAMPGFRLHSLGDRKGGDPSEWPEHLRVREFPR